MTVKIGLNCRDRQVLYDRINKRVDIMLEEGLLEEAERVINSDLSYTSIKAIGYKELIPYFKENKNLNDCVEKWKPADMRKDKLLGLSGIRRLIGFILMNIIHLKKYTVMQRL